MRSPLRFNAEAPPCTDEECILPSNVGNYLVDLKLAAGEAARRGDHVTARQLREQFTTERDVAMHAARKAARAAQPSETKKGDDMCRCNEKRDALEREREARQKMIADSANAYRQPTAPDDNERADDDKPTTPGESREAAARRAMVKASANAHKTGGR